MALKNEFEMDWKKEFYVESLPALRCLDSRASGEILENLDIDLDKLKKRQKELSEELDHVIFSYDWLTEKRKKLQAAAEAKADAASNRNYLNLHERAASDDTEYYNVDKKHDPRPVPKPRLSHIGRSPSAPAASYLNMEKAEALPSAPGPNTHFLRTMDKISSKLGERLPIAGAKPTSPSKIVSDENLRILSQKLEHSFITFGREVLKFTTQEIEMCQRLSDEGHKQALRMLLKWKRRLGQRGTTAALIDLLKTFGYGPDIWGYLEDHVNFDPSIESRHQLESTPDFEPYTSKVIKDYITSEEGELSVTKGDTVMVQDKGRDGWLLGVVLGARGWIPGNCLSNESSLGRFRFLFLVETLADRGHSAEGFLTFKKGEYLDVIEETKVKLKAHYRGRTKDGLIGLVAATDCRRLSMKKSVLWERIWFHPMESRREAEQLLLPCAQGTFLIREASREPGNFVLSVKSGDEISNFMITTNTDGYRLYNMEFQSIQQAIDHYKRNVIRDNLFLTMALQKK